MERSADVWQQSEYYSAQDIINQTNEAVLYTPHLLIHLLWFVKFSHRFWKHFFITSEIFLFMLLFTAFPMTFDLYFKLPLKHFSEKSLCVQYLS
jgi:phosphoglycerol transferase MdoB-like AlkP superfamily enzyme